MDEVMKSRGFAARTAEKLRGIFIIDPVSFSTKKRINLRGIAWLVCLLVSIFFVGVFLVPTPPEEVHTYSERQSIAHSQAFEQGSSQANSAPYKSNTALGMYLQNSSGGGGSSAGNRNSTMVITREGDASTMLPPGTRFTVRLAQNVTVTTRPIPVIGRIVSSVSSQSSLAIPEDAQIFGEASLDPDSQRANITWQSISSPDGRSKALNAIALGSDSQAGVEGNYHSEAIKNTAGGMVSRFVGGFAAGAINHGPFGANQGGLQNGLFQGAADTAKDRADAWSENLKKPRAWIELETGSQFQAILSQPFKFRDPGGVN